VRVRGDWFAVPCKTGDKISWLGEETLRRYYRKKAVVEADQKEQVFEVRKAKGGANLDPVDKIGDVLDDNDFVTVGRKMDSIKTGFTALYVNFLFLKIIPQTRLKESLIRFNVFKFLMRGR